MDKAVYSLCRIYPFHCPIDVKTKNSLVKFVESHPKVPGMDDLITRQLVETGSFMSDFDKMIY